MNKEECIKCRYHDYKLIGNTLFPWCSKYDTDTNYRIYCNLQEKERDKGKSCSGEK